MYLHDYGGFYGRVLAGAKKVLAAAGYELIVCSGEKSRAFLSDKLVDGAIVLDSTFSDESLLLCANRGRKLVVLDRELAHKNIGSVLLDNAYGAQLAMAELVDQGCQKILILCGPEDNFDSRIRQQAAVTYARENKITYELLQGDFTIAAGIKQGEYVCQALKKAKIGVFALNDNMALGLYLYFRDEPNVVIGNDLKIVGFDALLVGQLTYPTLSTIYFSQSYWG